MSGLSIVVASTTRSRPPRACANARASVVFPRPGLPVRSTWSGISPLAFAASTASRSELTAASCPTTSSKLAGRTAERWIFRGLRLKWPDRATSVGRGSFGLRRVDRMPRLELHHHPLRVRGQEMFVARHPDRVHGRGHALEVDRSRRTRRLGGRKWPDRATCRTDLERGLAGGRDITLQIRQLLAVLVPEDERVRRLALDRQEVAVD